MKFTNPNRSFPQTNPLISTLILATCLAITGCGRGSIADLEEFINATLAAPVPVVEPLCDQINCEGGTPAYRYARSNQRDPFRRVDSINAINPIPAAHPDPHPAEELEQYPLDSLRMVGTVDRAGHRWGLVQTPDGTIHPIENGNYLGRNGGKVHEIMVHRITLNEIIWTNHGWDERTAVLSLIEG